MDLRDQLIALRAMLRKNVVVAFRYPVNVLSRIGRVFFILPLFFCAIAMFWDGGLAGLLASSDGRLLGGVMIYGFVIYQFTADSLWMIGYYVRQEQIEGTFESLHLSPASRTVYLLARFAEPLVLSSLNAAVAIALASLVFLAPPLGDLGLALYVLACTLAGLFGLGCLFAGVTLLLHESAQALASLLQFTLLAACGMVVPFSTLPAPLLAISRAIPLSYCVDLFRSAMMGYPSGYPELAAPRTALVIVTLWALGTPVLGLLCYRLAERSARRRGLLGRF